MFIIISTMALKENIDDNIVYCICPKCKTMRKKINGTYNIIKRGKERSKIARFFCKKCKIWFNEHTGEGMRWMDRV